MLPTSLSIDIGLFITHHQCILSHCCRIRPWLLRKGWNEISYVFPHLIRVHDGWRKTTRNCEQIFLRQTHNTNANNTYIEPQAAYRSCSGAFVWQTAAGIQHIGRRLSLRPQTFSCDQTAIRSPCLPFNGLHPRNPCNYMDCYSFTDSEGMEGWVNLVG